MATDVGLSGWPWQACISYAKTASRRREIGCLPNMLVWWWQSVGGCCCCCCDDGEPGSCEKKKAAALAWCPCLQPHPSRKHASAGGEEKTKWVGVGANRAPCCWCWGWGWCRCVSLLPANSLLLPAHPLHPSSVTGVCRSQVPAKGTASRWMARESLCTARAGVRSPLFRLAAALPEKKEEEEEEEAYRSGGIEWVTHGYAMPTTRNQLKDCARVHAS